jgi:anti-sigma B factor antagonist
VLTIEIQRGAGFTVCRLHGEADAWNVADARAAFAELVGDLYVVFDLCPTSFMDSAGLGALIGGIRRVRDAGGDAVIACSGAALLRMLRTTGLDRVVRIEPNVDDARSCIAAIGAGGDVDAPDHVAGRSSR